LVLFFFFHGVRSGVKLERKLKQIARYTRA